MMQESTVTPMMQGLSTSSNNGDDWDPVVDRNIMMEKNRELKKSKYIHSTLVDGTGIKEPSPKEPVKSLEVSGSISVILRRCQTTLTSTKAPSDLMPGFNLKNT